MNRRELPADFDPSLPNPRVTGGREFPFTTVGDWVLLSGVSDRAFRLYSLLRMHVHYEQAEGGKVTEDNRVWPGQELLRNMLKGNRDQAPRRQTVADAMAELVAIGAVDVTEERYGGGMRRRNFYRVHQAPPGDYRGPRSQQEWNTENRSVEPPQQHGVSAGGADVRSSAPPSPKKVSAGRANVRSSAPPEVRPGEPPEVTPSAQELQPQELHPSDSVGEEESPRAGAREAPAANAAPPPSSLRPERGRPETWKCDYHLGNPLPPGAEEKPCRGCKAVRERCQAREDELKAADVATEAEKRDRCTWHAEGRWVIDPETGLPFEPAVKCDCETTSPEAIQARRAAAVKPVDSASSGPSAAQEEVMRLVRKRPAAAVSSRAGWRGTSVRVSPSTPVDTNTNGLEENTVDLIESAEVAS